MRASRPLAALTGFALLGIALTACQDQASGQIVARNDGRVVQTLTNPSVRGCHRFPGGVTHVTNLTQSSLRLYTTRDCTVPAGGSYDFVDIGATDQVVRSTGLWSSFDFAPE
ncbi:MULTISPECIES: hypothetical protein [Streptomyces]|uniref:Lipoprotein n=1 Tax=Streptomyces murinus TaxID=33900 RepID=A0A7W3NKI6_STRMR|nr:MULTISPECIES: hypothetical protein [Streptomyces]NDK29182.1 hypothetical protein [Streptomyces sp. TR1341]MBA9052176.1 hypothetical protein [Streptomyces murinus]UWW93434.1 hypothetical protein GO605_23400 [Streptomyces murinus]WSI84102.1 hypothetical protein OG516_06005 [Streptomyces murinus]WUD05817.1 hypothetical protein OG586_06080 [Streptomyces murinus]